MSKILVIDDDDAFRATLARMLVSQGLEVNQAATGAEGVQLARTERPDLILCDVELGGVGGNLVLYAVRRDPQLAALPFILMSGFGVSGDTTLPGMERGADAFLSKPFTPGKLAPTIAGSRAGDGPERFGRAERRGRRDGAAACPETNPGDHPIAGRTGRDPGTEGDYGHGRPGSLGGHAAAPPD